MGGMHNPQGTHALLTEMNGGFMWDCMGDASHWILQDDVKKALHLDGATPGQSRFTYANVGPASQTLYPELAQRIRLLLYSGDADSCVPYTGTEDMLMNFEGRGIIKETNAWAPWFATRSAASPAGYLTNYLAPGSS